MTAFKSGIPRPLPLSPAAFPMGLVRGWRGMRQAWNLAERAYGKEPFLRRLKLCVKWALAAGLHPNVATAWFGILEAPDLIPFSEGNPILAFKPFRPYLSIHWGAYRCMKVILDTFAFATHRGGALERVLYGEAEERLAVASVGELGEVVIDLGTDARFRKEGEYVLFLRCESLGGTLAILSFSLERKGSTTWTVLVGCVQGGENAHPQAVRRATKAMHGMRPKALMLFLIQETAQALGATKLRGAGARIQVHARKHAIHIPCIHGLSFDYDGLWAEYGGRGEPDGWFDLPLTRRKRSPEEIKPGKRAMYTRRYAFLAELSDQIHGALGAAKSPYSSQRLFEASSERKWQRLA